MSSKKANTKVKRNSNGNGQIVKGSARLKNSGRPKGARSTGKKIKSAQSSKSNLSAKTKKSAGCSNNLIKSPTKQHISTSKSRKSRIGVKRNKQGQVQRGSASIGGGRKAGYSKADRLEQVIAEVSMEKGRKDWLKDLIRRSYKSESLSIALLGRLFPALKSVQLQVEPQDAFTKQKTADIRNKLKKRFGISEVESVKIKEVKAQLIKLNEAAIKRGEEPDPQVVNLLRSLR